MPFIPGPLEGRIKKLQERESAAAAQASGEPSKRRRLLPATATAAVSGSTPKRKPLSFTVTPTSRPGSARKGGTAGKKKRPPAAVDNTVRAFAPPPSLAKALLPFQKQGVEFALNQVRTTLTAAFSRSGASGGGTFMPVMPMIGVGGVTLPAPLRRVHTPLLKKH